MKRLWEWVFFVLLIAGVWFAWSLETRKPEPTKQREYVTCELDDRGRHVDCWTHYEPEYD
jgi:hypothetical protein